MRLLQDGITKTTEQRPEAIAIVSHDQQVSYAFIESESNRLAHCLVEAGCQRGDRVALLIPKSPMAIVAILATLKADAIYVPVDPAMPAVRAAKIINKSGARWMLAAGPVQKLLNEMSSEGTLPTSIRLGWLDMQVPEELLTKPVMTLGDVASCSSTTRAYANNSSDPAHILFTSGSTGDPKGVVITHNNVCQFVDWGVRYFNIDPTDRNSGQTPLHFDLSTFDIYGTLTAGAQLHLVAPELNLLPHKLAAFMRESRLTQWFSVPSILNYMAKFDAVQDHDFPEMKRLLWCGEVLPTPALQYWMQKLPHVTFTNLYGPTEATIASSYYTMPQCPTSEDQPLPIGVPCAGESLLVLDEGMRPVPTGEIGDLYIAGVGLSPGYWEDPEKTDAAFLTPTGIGVDHQRIYKTGDLASMGPDGLLYFHGRADSQIKSRGYRIELGEIEAALNALGSLTEVAVVGARTDSFEGTLICCAYVAAAGSHVTSTTLRNQLSKMLPSYMLPSRWQEFELLPKNVNGKIDRRQLKDLFEKICRDQRKSAA